MILSKNHKWMLVLILFFPFGNAQSAPITSSDGDTIMVAVDDKPVPSNDDYSEALGFQNLGATCFANSVFKLLMAHPRVLDLSSDTASLGETPKKALKLAFYDLMSTLLERKKLVEDSPHRGALRNAHFSKELSLFFDAYDSYLKTVNLVPGKHFLIDGNRRKYLRSDQIDAGEYLVQFLDVLDYKRFFGGFNQGFITRFDSGSVKTYIEPSTEVRLDLPIDKGKVQSISSALADYFAPERMADKDNLPHNIFLQPEPANKEAVLVANEGNIPNQLIIGLKRFVYSERTNAISKLMKPIGISKEITLKFYEEATLSEGSPRFSKRTMSPVALVAHKGSSVLGGHYVAYTFDSEKQGWLKHDDTTVSFLKEKDFQKEISGGLITPYQILYVTNPNMQ